MKIYLSKMITHILKLICREIWEIEPSSIIIAYILLKITSLTNTLEVVCIENSSKKNQKPYSRI